MDRCSAAGPDPRAAVVAGFAPHRRRGQPIERLERELRDEIGRQAQASRVDLGSLQQVLLTQSGDVARTQNEQIDSFRTPAGGDAAADGGALRRLSDDAGRAAAGCCPKPTSAAWPRVRQAVETRLPRCRRATRRSSSRCAPRSTRSCRPRWSSAWAKASSRWPSGSSRCTRAWARCRRWRATSGRLKRVLTNVKTRGMFGEVQLAALLEQVFTPEQYARQRRDRAGQRRARRVRDPPARPARGRRAAVAADRRQVPARGLRAPARCAGTRRSRPPRRPRPRRSRARARRGRSASAAKYVAPPHTTDFAILFVPTEGLYAEALRRPGLVRGAAARAPRHAGRPDHAAGHAQQPADGLSHAGARTAQRRGLGGAGRGEDRVREVRRRAGQDQEEAAGGAEHDRRQTEQAHARDGQRALESVEALPEARCATAVRRRPDRTNRPMLRVPEPVARAATRCPVACCSR